MELLEKKQLNLLFFILIVSSIALAVAYIAEYSFGFKPCILCLYERVPYFAAALVAIIALLVKALRKIALLVAIIIFCLSTALSFYHVGVEQRIFQGTEACVSETKQAISIEELKAEIFSNNAPSCKEAAFKFLSISFAGWNFILSVFLTIFTLKTYLRFKNAARGS